MVSSNGDQPPMTAQRGAHYIRAIGRLKPGVTMQQADADAHAIGGALEKQYPDTNGHLTLMMHPKLIRWSVMLDPS